MNTLNWILKFQENWQKNYANTRIPDLLFILFCLILLHACAARAPERIPPRTDLGDPFQATNLAPTPQFQKAYRTYLSGEPNKARSGFLEITKKSPDYYPAYLAIAYTYLAEDRFDFAEGYIGKALELNPDYAQARFVLAHLYETRQNYTAAMEQLDEVARINPQYPNLNQARNILNLKATEEYLERGRQLADENPEEALRFLKAAYDMAPEISQIPVEIADILLKQNNCREAVNYLTIAVEKDPANLEVKKKLADCLMNLQEYRQAEAIYQDLVLQMPDQPEIRQRLQQAKRQIFIESLPLEYHGIPHSPEITRAQLAAYLVLQLEPLQKFGSERQQIIVDIIQHWAQSYIQKVVDLGIMDVYPNRTFQPTQPITKLELAKAATRILEIIELSGPGSFPADPSLDIPDIPAGHLYRGLVSKPLAARIMTLDSDGRFHPSRRVTGAEAMSVVNQLKKFMEFL